MTTNRILLFSALLFLPLLCIAQNNAIVLDGEFNEWDNMQDNYIDTEDDGNEVDFVSFSVTNDDDFLYVYFSLSEETLINKAYSVYLEIDTDNNFWTGYRVNGIGAELGWAFGGKKGFFNIDGTPDIVKFSDIGFRCLPSVTSHDFELAIDRHALPDGQNKLFPSDTIKICFYESNGGGDLMPNDGETFTYVFKDNPVVTPLIDIEKNEGSLRLLTYNVLHDGLLDPERAPDFEKLIGLIKPDIITFNECWSTTAMHAEGFLKNIFPGQPWQCLKADEGNITCSIFEREKFWRVLADARITAVQYQLPAKFGSKFIVINSHLKCCDADEIRQNEVDAMASFILDGISAGGTVDFPDLCPFVISGDLNLVGNMQQLRTLKTGQIIDTASWGMGDHPDWDNSQLKDEIARHTDKRMAYTWRNDDSDYWPGRLDYHIFSNSVMSVDKSFVLCTQTMSDERLQQYGLERGNTSEASDHLPRVTDFHSKTSGLKKEQGTGFHLYPNPYHKRVNIRSDRDVQFCRIHLLDASGKFQREVYSGQMMKNENIELEIDNGGTKTSGLFYLMINLPDEQIIQKLINL